MRGHSASASLVSSLGVLLSETAPVYSLRFTLPPPSCYFPIGSPGVAELADAADSKSAGDHSPCGFDSLLRDHLFPLPHISTSRLLTSSASSPTLFLRPSP